MNANDLAKLMSTFADLDELADVYVEAEGILYRITGGRDDGTMLYLTVEPAP